MAEGNSFTGSYSYSAPNIVTGLSIVVDGVYSPIIQGTVNIVNLGPAGPTQYAPAGILILEGIPVDSVLQLNGTA